eukprot:1234512-Pleurochrysis_carterae.AAC.4
MYSFCGELRTTCAGHLRYTRAKHVHRAGHANASAPRDTLKHMEALLGHAHKYGKPGLAFAGGTAYFPGEAIFYGNEPLAACNHG